MDPLLIGTEDSHLKGSSIVVFHCCNVLTVATMKFSNVTAQVITVLNGIRFRLGINMCFKRCLLNMKIRCLVIK